MRQKSPPWLLLCAFLLVLTLPIFESLNSEASSKPLEKLIALTFDDGPKPYVLYGWKINSREPSDFPGLLAVLDKHKVRATFFYMGWRFSDQAQKQDKFVEAGKDVFTRGHRLENHTCSHGPMLKMQKQYGEAWVMRDIDCATKRIQNITGERPVFIRPPEWSIDLDLKRKLEARGYRVVTKSTRDIAMPPLFEDVDSEDWAFYEKDSRRRPACEDKSLSPAQGISKCVLEKVTRRERVGIFGHILVFHETQFTAQAMELLIPLLGARDYRFVLLGEYMQLTQKEATK